MAPELQNVEREEKKFASLLGKLSNLFKTSLPGKLSINKLFQDSLDFLKKLKISLRGHSLRSFSGFMRQLEHELRRNRIDCKLLRTSKDYLKEFFNFGSEKLASNLSTAFRAKILDLEAFIIKQNTQWEKNVNDKEKIIILGLVLAGAVLENPFALFYETHGELEIASIIKHISEELRKDEIGQLILEILADYLLKRAKNSGQSGKGLNRLAHYLQSGDPSNGERELKVLFL